MTDCRKCEVCQSSSHHWLECSDEDRPEGWFECKHCGQMGVECDECGGEGCDIDYHRVCPGCEGEGVIIAEHDFNLGGNDE